MQWQSHCVTCWTSRLTSSFPLVDRLSTAEAGRLRDELEAAAAHQTSLVEPPHNPLLRQVAELKETVTLALHDESSPWHPRIQSLANDSPVPVDHRTGVLKAAKNAADGPPA